ncbi:MAG: dockerin type I repeat-containing protein, partial [Ruminococcus sp.]|nr:dockerin type I repeat-containing protein [Ruminococcus sp.]
VPYSIIAVGNGEDTYLNGANWDPCDPANAMTEVADGIWEMTMEDIYAFENYQIKFAVNSVDEEGNPTSNPWAHNFGTEEETQYPVNTELDAFYNGKNCIFEVEEDASTVKLQLDLRNFDFKTKTGAKMTITVTAPEPQAEGTIGDVNKDSAVDVTDAMLIQQVAIGKTPNSIFSNKLADVNNDGVINVLDASCVQRYAAGMTKKTGNAGVAYEDITPVSDDPQIME